MDSLWKDMRVAFRMLRKNPAFALTAIVTLALGISASTAIFSVVNAVLLRPLPYRQPDRLAIVWGDLRNRNVRDFPMSSSDFRDFRAETKAFEGLAGVNTFRIPFGGDGFDPEQVPAAAVTTNLFSLLGAHIVVGRDFVDADATPQPPAPNGAAGAAGAAPAAPRLPAMMVLSYEFWKRRYGGDPNIVGRTIDLGGGQSTQIVGVVEPGFELLFAPSAGVERTPDVYLAARINFADTSVASRINVFLRVVGRLAPGATLAQAQREVDAFAANERAQFTIDRTAGFYMRVEPMHGDMVAGVRPAILALMGAVAFVLLIACANVANLLLVRASSRERELAVRAALGGSQARLIRQMMLESLILGGCGAVAGLWAAALGVTLLVRMAPAGLPQMDAIRIDPSVLLFTVAAGLVSVVLFGTVPALRASRPDLMDVLRASGRTAGQRTGTLMRSGVVVAEVALSLVLLIGCGLMVRSFMALEQADPGFEPGGLLTFFALPSRLTQGPAGTRDRETFVRTFTEQLRAIPGVQSVTAASQLPLEGSIGNARWGTAAALTDPARFRQANLHVVIPGYFATMRTRLLAGRDFSEVDDDTAAKNIIIDDKLAARAFPGQNAVGQRLLARIATPEALWYTVVGVVAHQRDETLSADGREVIFIADGELGSGNMSRWALRTGGDPSRLAPLVRATVHRFDPTMSVAEVQPMQAFVDRAEAPTRFALALIGTFAGIAIVLAAVGLYGVLSTVVRQRTAEIGMRMAFGAPSQSIFALVIAQGVRLSAIGIVCGLIAAVLLTRAMSTMLVGVRPTDPVTYVAISVLFLVVATAAAWLPARRAAALDPTIALREE